MTNLSQRSSHFTRKQRDWQEAIVILLLLPCLTLAFLWPQLVQGRQLYWGDINLYFRPMLAFLHETLTSGRIPLWNPHILCGAPYVGNPQTWPLYPFAALLKWASVNQFLNWTIGFHLWLAGVGVYLYLRRSLHLSLLAGVFGAMVFMFGGQLVSKEQFPNMVQAAAYLPWTVWLLDRLLDRKRIADACWLGIALGLQLLAAHAQMTLLTLYLLFAYGVSHCYLHRHALLLKRLLGLLAISGVIAIGLSAGQVLPTAELVRDAGRQQLSLDNVNRFFLPVNELGNFVLPSLHGHPFTGDWTAHGNLWETCCYIGFLPFGMALFGVVMAFRRANSEWLRFWVYTTYASVWMAVGKIGGLYTIAYNILPGFKSFHDPARCLLWGAFALSILAASGLDHLSRQVHLPKVTLGLGIGICVIVFIDLAHFDGSLYPLADLSKPSALFPVAAIVSTDPDIASHQSRYMTPDSARIWYRFTTYRSYRQNEPNYLAYWNDTLASNLTMPDGPDNAFGYDPIARRDTQYVLGTSLNLLQDRAGTRDKNAAATWAGMLGIKYLSFLRVKSPAFEIPGLKMIAADPTMPPLGSQQQDDDRVMLCLNTHWQSRARLTTNFQTTDNQDEAMGRMLQSVLFPGGLDLQKTTVIAGEVPFSADISPNIPVRITDIGPDSIEARTNAKNPALLVVADTLHPGWHAAIDGAETPIFSANGFLRAVAIPRAGAHRVIFTYRPTSYLMGLYLTLVTYSALIGYLCACVINKRRQSASSKQDSE